MGELDRSRIIGLLEELGAEDDEAALAAARALDKSIRESGLSWDDLLEPDDALEEEDIEDDEIEDDDLDEEDLDEDGLDGEDLGEAESGDDEDPEEQPPPAAELEEDGKVIDRLLARKGMSRETRAELTQFKKDIAAGEFTTMDSRYVRALAKRLEA